MKYNLNYIGCIAQELGWSPDETLVAIEELDNGFMVPELSHLSEDEAREYLDDPDATEGLCSVVGSRLLGLHRLDWSVRA